LKDWVRSGWLIEHVTSAQEIIELLEVADRDLAESQTQGLNPDWRLSIAYNSALQTATAALAASGFRAAREAHHYRVIQSLAHTVGADAKLITQFDRFRKKRNVGSYERAGMVSEREAKEMFHLARRLRREVENWLRANHPELITL